MNNEPSSPRPGDQSTAATPQRAGSDERHTHAGEGVDSSDRSLRQAASEDLEELRRFANEQTEQVKAAVSRRAETDKNVAARQLSSLAAAIVKVGAELEQSDQQAIGRYAKQMGSSLQRFSRDIEGRSLGEVAAMAEDFGRKRPLVFLGVAAIAGLTASRFLTASATRRPSRPASQPSE